MFKSNKLASTFSRKISAAARLAIEDITNGRAQQEPNITDQLIAYIQSEVQRANRPGLTWSAMTLTDRGPGSQERRKYGVDLVGSLEIRLRGLEVRKGFLAQAKKVDPNERYPNQEYQRLRSQCEDMLRLSAASYVFLYSAVDGFSVVPALSVLSARNCNPHELTTKPLQRFFSGHFDCFIILRKI